jgi:yecA family protein
MAEYRPLGKRDLTELSAFLADAHARGGLDIFMLEGFLCALACGPNPIVPTSWLPVVFGEAGPRFKDLTQAQRVAALLMRHSNAIAFAVHRESYVPLLPEARLPGMESRAQPWSLGFVAAMALDRTWQRLFQDKAAHILGMPILLLAEAKRVVRDASPDSEATEGIIAMLPEVVTLLRRYWLEAPRPMPSRPRANPALVRGREGATVHRLKIELRGIRPTIWRRVEIRSGETLPHVSRALLMAMGWTDTHLHAFRRAGQSYAVPDPDYPADALDERRVALAELAPSAKDHFVLEYDFGDGWVHRVTVEAIVAEMPAVKYPRCLTGKRACPPEDCGGPWGYVELLKGLADPTNARHAELLKWRGPIDPELFDLGETNAGLATIRRGRRSRVGARTSPP